MEKSQLNDKLAADLKSALKQKDSRKISTLRLILAEVHNQEISKKQPATDADIMKVLSGAAKKHEDSIAQFETAGRQDLVEAEREELVIIKSYLPEPLADDAVEKIIDEAIAESPSAQAADFGKIMKLVMPKIAGRASGQMISEKLKAKLS